MLDELRKQAAIIEKLIRGLEAAEEKPPEQPPPVDLEAWKISVILPGLAAERAATVAVALAVALVAEPVKAPKP